jgi:hypothetical protein
MPSENAFRCGIRDSFCLNRSSKDDCIPMAQNSNFHFLDREHGNRSNS